MVESNLDPPEEKRGWFIRFIQLITPTKWHKFYTKEAIVAYNLGGLTTDLKWIGILAVPWDIVMPIVRVYWSKIVAGLISGGKVLKESVLDFLTLLHNGT